MKRRFPSTRSLPRLPLQYNTSDSVCTIKCHMKLVLIIFVFTGSLIFNFIYSDTVQWAWLPHYGKIFDILLVIFRSELSTLRLKITISPEPVICKMSTRIKFYFWRQNDRHFSDLMFWKYLRTKSGNSHASLHINVTKNVCFSHLPLVPVIYPSIIFKYPRGGSY